ncbi:MAG: carbohydrate ABC transporter permease [Bacilli bacterium]|nr:carbohydrate ABC transporter permease [Bacilli bacterium]
MALALIKRKPKAQKKPIEKANAGSIIVMVILFLYSLTLIALLLWGFNTSFKTSEEYKIGGNIIGFPDFVHSEYSFINNYYIVLNAFKYQAEDHSYISAFFGRISNTGPEGGFTFGLFMINSFVYCIVGSFARTFVALVAGYLVSKYKYKFSKIIYVVMLIIMAIPIVGSAPAMLKLTRDLAIYDSYLGMLLLNLNFTGLYFFVFAAYFQDYSDTYIEAAEIDGSNQFRAFFTIVFPMASKLFWTVFLLNFITLWNDYQTPLLYYPNHPTLSYAIYKMSTNSVHIIGSDAIEIPQIVAGCMLLVLPVLALFLATRKALLGNMSAGGIKE